MDYALNLPHSELPDQIMHWLEQPALEAHAAKWLLLDAAMIDEKSLQRLAKAFGPNFVNIFAGTRYAVYGLQAPHLIRLDELESPQQRAVLSKLLQLGSGIPALAVLDACADASLLSRCLGWFAQTHTLDGMEFYCRLADTRITPALLQGLEAEQLDLLGQCVQQWQIVNRLGSLEALLPTSLGQLNAYLPDEAFVASEPFVLTDAQYATLMRKAEPDEVFYLLCEGNPELVPDERRGDFHQRLLHLVQKAHQCGLEQSPDVVMFAVIALSTHDGFDQHPELQETWLNVKHKLASFSELVGTWPDTVWDALAQPAALP